MRLTLLPDGDSPDSQDDQGRGGEAVERGGGRGKRRTVFFEEDEEDEEAPVRDMVVHQDINNQAGVLSCARGGPAGISTPETHGDREIQGGQNNRKQRKNIWSTITKLQFREIGFNCSRRPCGSGSGSFMPRPSSFSEEVFSTIKNKQAIFDIYRCKDVIQKFEGRIRKRSAVLQILPLKDIVAVVLSSGLSFVLSRVTNKISILNRYEDELIVSIFYNKEDKSLITTSTRLSNGSISCLLISTPLQCIGSNNQNSGCQIFESENIAWPDSVEFDASNSKALIKHKSTYRIFDLKDYSLLHEISKMNVHQVVFRSSFFLIKFEQIRHAHPLKIFCAESFEELHSFVLVPSSKQPEVLSVLHGKLIIKENSSNQNGNMQILDLHSLKT